jgi:NAD(P)-dependent dehydrogenase (short-subunit alcohol dehydrogenase family)
VEIHKAKGKRVVTRLAGRVAIVTGAGRGIGVAYAKALAAEGAKVAVCDVLDPDNTVNIIKQQGGEALGFRTDVTDSKAVTAMVEETVAAFGKVDILVNNAALFADLSNRSFLDIPSGEWDRVMTINTRGVFECARAVVPDMRKRKYGKIINIASGTVFKGSPGKLHYVASKGAVVAMTRVMARELGADNICVNSIAPGMTMSEGVADKEEYINSRTPSTRCFPRHEQPDDLTGAVVFLSSGESDFMTGQCMVVDGGAAMH